MADLGWANLGRANLDRADLRGANLGWANLGRANLFRADLGEADLGMANLMGANLDGADLGGAICYATVFANVDLSKVEGLDAVLHQGPSHISTDTLIRSGGKIPEAFLRDCGVPDTLIAYLPSLIGSTSPIQFFSCFISYATNDEEFASRLHNDFQAAGIRCWKWDHDARTGRTLWGEID
jgi:hypothetical protein